MNIKNIEHGWPDVEPHIRLWEGKCSSTQVTVKAVGIEYLK